MNTLVMLTYKKNKISGLQNPAGETRQDLFIHKNTIKIII